MTEEPDLKIDEATFTATVRVAFAIGFILGICIGLFVITALRAAHH